MSIPDPGEAPRLHQKRATADPRFEEMWLRRNAASSRLIDTAIPELVPPPGRTVFLAHAFTSLLDAEGRVDEAAQRKLTLILSRSRAARYAVHCALEREEWGKRVMTPETAIELDRDQVGKADYLVSFPQGSGGAFMELGMRAVNSRPTLIVWSQSLLTESPDRNAEERFYAEAMVGMLGEQGVPSALLEDDTTDLEAFGATVVPQILEWLES